MADSSTFDLDAADLLLALKNPQTPIRSLPPSGKENSGPPPLPPRSTRPVARPIAPPFTPRGQVLPPIHTPRSQVQPPIHTPTPRYPSAFSMAMPLPAVPPAVSNSKTPIQDQPRENPHPTQEQGKTAAPATNKLPVIKAFVNAHWTPPSEAQDRKPATSRGRPKDSNKVSLSKVDEIPLSPSREAMLKEFMRMHELSSRYVIKPDGPPVKITWPRMPSGKENAPMIEKDKDWELLYSELAARSPLPPITVNFDLDVWATHFMNRRRSRYEDTEPGDDNDKESNPGPGTKKPRIGDFNLDTQELGMHAQNITKANWCGTHNIVCFKKNGACVPVTNPRMKLWCLGCVDGTADYQHPPNIKEFDGDYTLPSQGLGMELPTLRGRAKHTATQQAPVINIHVPPQPPPSENFFNFANTVAQFQRQMGNNPLRQLNPRLHPFYGDALFDASYVSPKFSRLETPRPPSPPPLTLRPLTPIPSPGPAEDLPRLTNSPIPSKNRMVAVALTMFNQECGVDIGKAITALEAQGFQPEDVREYGLTAEWFEDITGLSYPVARRLRRHLIDYAATTRFKLIWKPKPST